MLGHHLLARRELAILARAAAILDDKTGPAVLPLRYPVSFLPQDILAK